LEDFCVEVAEDMAAPSAEVLEALPAPKKLELEHMPGEVLFAKSFQPVIRALHRGFGLQALQELKFNDCLLGEGDFVAFAGALKSSGCANNLVKLWFGICWIDFGGANALAKLIRQDALPALKKLILFGNGQIGDEGVMDLGEALRDAPRTLLSKLNLKGVGMCEWVG
jgi:hypothetical protein